MIPPIIRVVYYMFLNKGRIGDMASAKHRFKLPITITENSKNSSIKILLDNIAIFAGGNTNKVSCNVTTSDFCQFVKYGRTAAQPRKVKITVPVRKTFWRVK